ncbi:unnamed protein product [Pieris brassicae]|uniref:Peptidase S1 domain-containing protein n=1 Tax=Pieris brassicae TaxID=7116 RepID=A0A9P0TFP7_PIEBR|nr:unnamed protein product [Pieris brassicae]
MWCKLVLFIVLVSHAASVQRLSVDFVENVKEFELNPGRIVSGWDASPGQFPYQVSLRARNNMGQLLGCGGSVIHQSWILTAAHCTANYLQVTVRAGLTRVVSAEYVWDSWEWYNHPTYISSQPGAVQPNDVSLIRLSMPITFSVNLQSIKLQSSWDSYTNYDNERLIASGWGRIWTNGPAADQLQWTYLRGIDDFQCSQLFGSRLINGNAICARWYNITSQSVCQGDSGGPLVQYKDGVPTLVGVTSFVAGVASGGCHSGHPGGFIRPGPFHSWFRQVTGLNLDSNFSNDKDQFPQ